MRQGMSRKKYIVLYTITFFFFCLGVFFLFVRKGKSMVWNQDGGPQYLPYLAYTGRYLRDFFSRALHGDFRLKMFDFSIGLGNDVQSVVRAHPLDFLSFFVPVAYTEILYHVIILLRWYLAGLCFTLFASLFYPLTIHVLTGSMIYIFSGFLLLYGVRHPIYASAMIMLPLLLAGSEKILRREGSGLFSFSVFLGFICNYYFMYQAAIACLVFSLVRFFSLYKERRIASFFRLLLRFALSFILGTGMAMATLLPVIFSLGSSARLAEQSIPENLLHFESWRHYYRWFLYLITPVRYLEGGISLNYSVLVLPALAMIPGRQKDSSRSLLICLLVGIIFLMSPVFSYVMSGFSAVNGRWAFIFSLLISMIYVRFACDLHQMNRRQKESLILTTGVFAVLSGLDFFASRKIYVLWAAVLLIAVSILLLCMNNWKIKAFSFIMLGICFVSCTANSFFLYSGRFADTLSEYYDAGTGIRMIRESEFSKFNRIKEEGFWRADSNLINSNRENYSLLLDYYPTSVYNSVISGPLTYGLLSLENPGIAAIHRIQGFDGQTVIENIANVHYFLTTYDGDRHAPYGFTRSESLSDGDNAIFINTIPLNFGFSCGSCIRRSDYNKLDPVSRGQIMLEACVLEDADADSAALTGVSVMDQAGTAITEETLSLPDQGENVKRTEKGYKVKKKGGYITLPFRRKAGCECYVRLSGFTTDKGSVYVHLAAGGQTTQFLMRGLGKLYSLNRTDYTLRLGYDEADQEDVITLQFTEKGTYPLENISVFYVPMADYPEKISRLNRDSLQEIVFDLNTVSGKASISQDTVMVFSVPYSSGWKVTVDGEEKRALCADVSWLGVQLEKGEHVVVLQYTSPGAPLGRVISIFAWLVFAAGFIVHKRLRSR